MQTTSPFQVHQRAYASATRGFPLTQLFNLPPRRRHCVAHPTTHRTKPCEIYWVSQILISEDVHDYHLVRKTWDRFLRLGLMRVVRERRAAS